jgi:uncharacterized BrkB/YihY/UPF0761 family membrane protein
MRPLLIVAGAYHLALGVLMAVAPRTFFDEIAAYPPYNDHFIRDISSFYLALGAVFVIAAARRSWQVPLLVFALVQYALHVLNHVWDVSDTEPAWFGPANLVSLLLVTAALWWLLRRATPERDT